MGARDLLRQYYSLPDHVVGFGEPSKGWSAAWVTPAVPSSAPMAVVPTMSSVLSPSDPAPAPENPVSSPKSLPTEIGFPRSLVVLSKSGSLLLLSAFAVFVYS